MTKTQAEGVPGSEDTQDVRSEHSAFGGRDTSSEYSISSMSAQSAGDECFRSACHAETSMERMETFLKLGQLTDVVIVTGSKRIPAHRLVLSAGSDYFSAMFTNGLRETNESEVELQGVDGTALSALVQYCYTGKVELREDTVETMLATACLLQLPAVVSACCMFLKRQLHPSNCIGIYLFAEQHGCSSLQKAAHSFTMEHFMEVVRNQEFLQLAPEEVAKLLASDDLNVPNEEAVFLAFMGWVKHDIPNRKDNIGHLLSFVKLPLLPPSFIADHVEINPIFKDIPACQDLIMEALKYHLLPERRPLLQSPRTHPRKSTLGSLYALGGMYAFKGATNIERYDVRSDTWHQVEEMTSRRLQFGVAVVDNKIIVVGGRDGLKTLNSVESYDPSTKTWASLPPMGTHRHGLGVGVLEGPLYAVGGHDGWSYLNTVERWDPQTCQWSYVAPMSSQRSTVGVAVLNNKLYAVGGRDGSSCLRTVECYDPHTNKWVVCSPMAKRRGGVGVGVANGYLYAMGGHDAPASNPLAARFDCVERYDPKTDTWTMVASMSTGKDGVGVILFGDKLFCVGGYDGHNYKNSVEVYDPQTNEWAEVGSLKTARAGTCLVVWKN